MEEQLFYISGPMTGYKDYNYPMFNYVTKALRDEGYQVISPAETEESLGHAQGSLKRDWDWWMRHALRGLILCNNIVMLPGWYESKGARSELDIALDLKMKIWRVETRKRPADGQTFIGRRTLKTELLLLPIDYGFAESDGSDYPEGE